MAKGRTEFDAGAVCFVVEQWQWDANIHSHPDQGVVIDVAGLVDGKQTALLRFNCFDVEHSYIYAPEGKPRKCWIDPITDGFAIAWSFRQMRGRLPEMIRAAGYGDIADAVDISVTLAALDAVEAAARAAFLNERRTVKHNRGTDIFEAGNIRFGLELRDLGDDGGLAIHVLADLVGTPADSFAEETELLAFDCFRLAPHYHYGPRNKNHRIYFDKTVVSDPLEWTLDVFKAGKLREMIAAAGYPGVAADVDDELVASLIPAIEAKAREMQPKAD